MPLPALLNAVSGLGRRLAGKPRQGLDSRLPYVRLGTEYGGYGVLLEELDAESLVYSFGLGEDISFDLALLERVGCRVFGFDPTPRSIAWVKQQNVPDTFQVRELGVAEYDGTASFAPPENPAHISHSMLAASAGGVQFQVRRLQTLMRELGHNRLDLLKMDVEGAEYAVLADVLAGGLRPKQVLVEFHHGMHGIPVARTEATLQALQEAGYRIFDAQPTGREFSLLLGAPR